MTMHLVGPALTTTNYKKRKNIKFKSAEAKAKYLAEKEAWEKLLKKHKIEPKKEEKKKFEPLTNYSLAVPEDRKQEKVSRPVDLEKFVGVCAKPAPKVYTGDKLIGIAVMHKSNLVPVFQGEDAKDLARMRRG